MIKHIKQEKIKEFLESFYNNPKEWYNKQIEEDFEFDEETQLRIIEEKFYLKNDEYSIQYIKNPTKRVCLEAVNRDSWVIQCIEYLTEEMCLKAVKKCGSTIQFVKNPTEEIQLEAIKENGLVIRHIKNPTEEMCIEAIKKDGTAIEYIPKEEQTPEIIEALFEHSNEPFFSDCFKYISEKFITKNLAETMINCDPKNINFLPKDLQEKFLEENPSLNKYSNNYYFE